MVGFRGTIRGWTFPDDGFWSQKQSLFRERGKIHCMIGSKESKALQPGARRGIPLVKKPGATRGPHQSSGTPRRLREEAATRSSSKIK